MERVRSPLVTAVATSAIARTWLVKLSASRFTFPVKSFHVPAAPGTLACPPSRPSTPTSRATVVTWSANVASVSVMLLMVSASAATSPFAFTVSFCVNSPLATAVTTFTIPRTCSVKLLAMKLTLSVKSFPFPRHSGHFGLAAQFSFGAHVARHAGYFAGEGVQLVHHGVNGVFEFQNFALHVHCDFA